MNLTINIPSDILEQYKANGYMDIRLHKDENHVNKITVATNESPYFAFLEFVQKGEDK